MELTILIPAVNEEESLKSLLPAVKKSLANAAGSWEILVVDGGSRDKTVSLAEAEGARVIVQKSPGFGGALKDGFAEARGEYVLVMDADGSHPASFIPNLWHRRGAYDLLVASRFCPGGSAEMPFYRYVLSWLLNVVSRTVLGFPVTDASSGYRIYRTAAIKSLDLRSRDFSVQQEILAGVLRGGGRAGEIPFHYDPRVGGKSKARVLPLAVSYARMLWTLSEERLALFTPGICLVLLLGLSTGLWGIGWGLPGPERIAVFPAKLRPTPEFTRRLADSWARLYQDIKRSHQEMEAEEPVAYVKDFAEIPPGWDFPPGMLANSYRSLLLQSQHPDEKKSFIILSQMRPWKLEFKPLYVQYGGAFIYPLGAFLKAMSWLKAAVLVPDVGHYLQKPGDMGRLYLLGRLFILLFHLGSLWVLYDLGRRLSGWGTGLAAAALYALCPAGILNSHVLKPHPYAAFWALASLRWMLLASRGGLRAHYLLCGLSAGMAAGASFALAPVLALPALAWVSRGFDGWTGEWRRALAGTAAGPALAAAANPYLLFSFKDFAWELEVYAPMSLGLGLGRLGEFAKAAGEGLGPPLFALAAAGAGGALLRGGGRRSLALALWGVFAILWGRFHGFPPDSSLRIFLPLAALACLLGVDLLMAHPWPAFKAAALAVLLADTALRGFVHLENMRLDAGPGSTRGRASDWLGKNVPAGSSVGLPRYPEPAHAPPFRWDLYRLVLFERPQALPKGREPGFLVLDAQGRGSLDNWAQNKYDLAAAFLPFHAGWARLASQSSFVNGEMYVYRRRAAPR